MHPTLKFWGDAWGFFTALLVMWPTNHRMGLDFAAERWCSDSETLGALLIIIKSRYQRCHFSGTEFGGGCAKPDSEPNVSLQ